MVTGGTGSFGHVIVRELLKYEPKKIIVFSRDEHKQYQMETEYKARRLGFSVGDVFSLDENSQFKMRNVQNNDVLKFALGDVRDLKRVEEITRNVDIIYHAAALKHVPFCEFHPFECVKTNILGAYNVKMAAIKNNVEKVIGISTDKAVKPVNAMGMSKALQEKLMLSKEEMEYETKFCMVRYGNVIGSRGSVIPIFKDKIIHNEPLSITHPEMTRFLLSLNDAIGLVFYATAETAGKEEIFVRKSPACKIIDLAKVMIENLTNKKDYPIANVGIRLGEKIHEVLVSEEEMVRTNEKDSYFIIKQLLDNMSVKNSFVTNGINMYSSDTTTLLNKDEIQQLLKKTGWL